MAKDNQGIPDTVSRDECVRIHNTMDKRLDTIEKQQKKDGTNLVKVQTQMEDVHRIVTNGYASKPSRKRITVQRIVEVSIVAVILIGGLLLAFMLFVGKLTADDVANILQAWRG